jgi:hypothetical protein
MTPPIAFLSAIIGDDAAAGLLTVVSLAINTITNVTAALNNQNVRQNMKNQGYDDYYSGSQGFDQEDTQQFQSVIMSTLAAIFSTINSTFSSLTSSQTPLTTYILAGLLSYVGFRIVYSIVSWVVRSVLNLVRTAIIISIVTIILWFVVNISSGGEGVDMGNGEYRHQDPISQMLHNLQGKFRTEFERQQQHLHQR